MKASPFRWLSAMGLTLWVLLWWTLAQMPPTPGVTLTLAWDENAPEEEVRAYRLYQATNIVGPWACVATVTNTNATVMLLAPQRAFWYVTASNFWGESGPSGVTNTPSPITVVKRLTVK